jgi:hypothetical protein
MMQVAEYAGSAVSTEKRAGEDVDASVIYVSTAPTGKMCAERVSLLVFSGNAVGWVAEFLGSAISRNHSAKRIAELWDDVDHMSTLHTDWNGYGSEPPNDVARDVAQQILMSATNLIVPNRVAASAQGGVGICFYQGSRYADIECLNTGEILATTSDGSGRPGVWEVKLNETKGALERIGQYIAS